VVVMQCGFSTLCRHDVQLSKDDVHVQEKLSLVMRTLITGYAVVKRRSKLTVNIDGCGQSQSRESV